MDDTTEQRRGMSEVLQRLSLIEVYIQERKAFEIQDRRWIRTLTLAFLIQFLALVSAGFVGAVKAGALIERLENIDVIEIRKSASTALQVLADHGEEIRMVEEEQLRIRGEITQIRENIREAGRDRWYRSDGEANSKRIDRIEKELFFKQ